MAKINLYCVKDNVADEVVICTLSKTDGLFVRNTVPFVSRSNPNYINDLSIYCIGEITESDLSVLPCPPRLVSWDAYKRPEEVGVIKVEK